MPATHFLLQLSFRMYHNYHAGLNKYNQEAYNLAMELFDQIPLACLINKKFLCVHGGVSPELRSVNMSLCSWRTSRRLTGSGRFLRLGFSVIWCGRIRSTTKRGLVRDWSRLMRCEGALTSLGRR